MLGPGASAEFEDGDKVSRFIGTIRDIGKLKRAEAQQQLLTRELEHRMKNTMAMVGAIASQTFLDRRDHRKRRVRSSMHVWPRSTRRTTSSRNRAGPARRCPRWIAGALAPHRTGEKRILRLGPRGETDGQQALSLALRRCMNSQPTPQSMVHYPFRTERSLSTGLVTSAATGRR